MSEVAAAARKSDELSQVIVHLSEQTQVPVSEVEEIYASEFERLTKQARIQMFVSVLAIGRARTLLHQSKSPPRPGNGK